MLSRCLSVSVAISLQKIPGAPSSHGGSCHRRLDGATGFSVLACLSLDPAREALLQEAGGRRRLVGQNTKLSTTGRNVSFWLILAVPLETGPAGDVTKNSQWLDCCCTKMKG